VRGEEDVGEDRPVGDRAEVLARVADLVPPDGAGCAVRVAVDGVDGAGKTVFAGELAAALAARGRSVLQASVDGFHHPRAVRYRRGRDSAEGFWLDSYDYDRLVAELLGPLGPGGSGLVRTAVHDWRTDQAASAAPLPVPRGTVLVLDGIFLHRDELRQHWDFSVYLDVDFAVSAPRMAPRDGRPASPAHPANRRYVDGQRRYLAACRPRDRATVVIDNTDLVAPWLVRPAG
jgi:uridine kinase